MIDRYIFIREVEDEDGNINEVRHTFSAITHDQIADHFNDFLRGCGFIFDINDRYELVEDSSYVSLTEEGEDFMEEYVDSEDSPWPSAHYGNDIYEKPINNSWPFANYGGEKCSKCGMLREQMGQNVCWEASGCGLGLNPTISTNHE
jgi:hypothetical protein